MLNLLEKLLEKAIGLAKEKHKDQVDKGGNPYIEHPIAVMNRLKTTEQKIVGVLHDVVEDTDVTLDDLRNDGYPEFIVLGVDSVTRRDGETRAAFINRAKQNELGRPVKIEDLNENSDLTRIPNPQEKDYKRVEMYQREIEYLTNDEWQYRNGKWKKSK